MRSSNAEMLSMFNSKVLFKYLESRISLGDQKHFRVQGPLWGSLTSNKQLSPVSLMFISQFMHFQSMSRGTNPVTGQTLKATGANMFGLHVSPDCRFDGINIITGIATPLATLQTTNVSINGFFNLINIGKC